MKYDFNTIIDRTGSGDLMHGALLPRWHRDDLLPMWVADMGFAVCPDIIDAMKQRLEHPILGYTVEPEDYYPAIHDWILNHHQWSIHRRWLKFIPGIVKGIGIVCNLFLKPDEKVIVMPPVYHPFFLTPQGNHREVVWNPLKRKEDGYYEMDFDNLAQVYDEKCKVLILCNPHNPGGICWDKETLIKLAEFCYEHHILVVSDEIHADLAIFGHKHIPFATVSDKAAQISITFQAPTKTFNIAGIISSYAIVPNEKIRKVFYHWLTANELDEAHIFAHIATIAAFRKGEEWRKQMLAYVEDNIKFVEDYCKEKMPQIRPLRPQASFLVWLNCRDLHLSHDQLLDLFIDKAHLALNDGEMFGPGGEGFMRLNVGCPRPLIAQALSQLAEAISHLR
ncbi:MalY/PatB family protein [Segatella bryantii]|jgi:cystathionine beta-lyase|uniref:cysteine-S-conjugate beta-lyase n=1 Tax=Segatella bryantii TaxID=77095 RepID=A0ABX4EI51_SEGBR|nr:PatB family C-S lyase [Segatella bryantii]MEE3414966.1 PatB family C-S lyase [Prevotella sp.]MDR4930372.1 PatB family C-S lyase [Segatella bryantii]OYP55730.1 cystathionine beta-lyase [Segatella bryantii]UKK76306.1 PatB family C-S lyase [Segatella bryantii]UKK80949.1 PatB family C-S lyase [Segatella bryantii]